MVACILGHHARSFLDPIEACLAESFLLRNRVNRIDVLLDIPGNELAAATYAALEVDKMVGGADGADALGDLLALSGAAAVLLARCLHVLYNLFQARCPL